jgi:hypothetical protein
MSYPLTWKCLCNTINASHLMHCRVCGREKGK